MLIPFDVQKVAQAGAVLLQTDAARRMSRLRLLKLLYIADREALQERSRPITGDRPIAMDHGPVLSQTYDLIKGTDFSTPIWQAYLRPAGPRDVELAGDPGVGKLSRYEIAKLQGVAARFAEQNDWDIAEYTHTFPEWRKNRPPPHSSKPIPLDDLLEALGLAQLKPELLAIERAEASFKDMISSGRP